ncbi:MAG: FAD-binding domain-containing protein [Pseudomonadota bacterium]
MVQLVWFKRDLRIADHAPLARAAECGPVLPLIIVEPEYWQLPETSYRHYIFWRDSARELIDSGLPAAVRVGAVTDVFDQLHRDYGIDGIWSHEETGNRWTYERDKDVAAWCKKVGVTWTEVPQFGVFRGKVDRNRWAKRWEAFMAEPAHQAPERMRTVDAPSDPWPEPQALDLAHDGAVRLQPGGRTHGLDVLESFFRSGRGADYRRAMSSPLDGADACSRLSPYLAYGCLSMREVVQAAYAERRIVADTEPHARMITTQSLDSFIARLHWHCHFIQKLESEPEIEYRDLHPAFREARVDGFGHPHYEAFAAGMTGFPFIDACMRSLIATGWINFRMRAMLTAFASYHLWLDWRASGTRLAQLFTDYEPGIHWSQTQMQSGSTAINTPRIYNPVKQSHDQDPSGVFIRRWVPELCGLSGRALHEPWTLSPSQAAEFGVELGKTYPERIIDHEKAARAARERLTALRRTEGFSKEQRAIFLKHGSRKSSRHTPKQGRAWKKRKPSDSQLEMDV